MNEKKITPLSQSYTLYHSTGLAISAHKFAWDSMVCISVKAGKLYCAKYSMIKHQTKNPEKQQAMECLLLVFKPSTYNPLTADLDHISSFNNSRRNN